MVARDVAWMQHMAKEPRPPKTWPSVALSVTFATYARTKNHTAQAKIRPLIANAALSTTS